MWVHFKTHPWRVSLSTYRYQWSCQIFLANTHQKFAETFDTKKNLTQEYPLLSVTILAVLLKWSTQGKYSSWEISCLELFCINRGVREHAAAVTTVGQCLGSEISAINPVSPVLSHPTESYQKHVLWFSGIFMWEKIHNNFAEHSAVKYLFCKS